MALGQDHKPIGKKKFQWKKIHSFASFVTVWIALIAFITGKGNLNDYFTWGDDEDKKTLVVEKKLPEPGVKNNDTSTTTVKTNIDTNTNIPNPNDKPIIIDSPKKQIDQTEYYFEKFKSEAKDLKSDYNKPFIVKSDYTGPPLKRLYDSTMDIIKGGCPTGYDYTNIQGRYLQAVITAGNLDLVTYKDTAHALRLYDKILKSLDEDFAWSNHVYENIYTIVCRMADILIVRNKLEQALQVIARIRIAGDEREKYARIFYGTNKLFLSISKVRDFKAGDKIIIKYNPICSYLEREDEKDWENLIENLGTYLAINKDVSIEYNFALMDIQDHRKKTADFIIHRLRSKLNQCCALGFNILRFDEDKLKVGKDRYNYLIIELRKIN